MLVSISNSYMINVLYAVSTNSAQYTKRYGKHFSTLSFTPQYLKCPVISLQMKIELKSNPLVNFLFMLKKYKDKPLIFQPVHDTNYIKWTTR